MLLEVENLRICFKSQEAKTEVVKGVSFTLNKGETLAIVGESGSGKSVTSMALARLLPPEPTCTVSGNALLNGVSLLDLSNKEMRRIRGKEIAYVFQEPSTSLNPYFSVGSQIAEALKVHRKGIKDVWGEVVSLLEQVGIRDARERSRDYPHHMSGGMKQRVMIAIALACQPSILVADEPTTALDVTIEAQIIELLRDLREKMEMSIILITHNFGIVDGFADKLAIMYKGEIVEAGPTEDILLNPQHEYTKSLIRCIPRIGANRNRLSTIEQSLGGKS